MRKAMTAVLLATVLCCIPSARGGVLFLAGTMKDGAFVPATKAEGGLTTLYGSIRATVEGGEARTTIELAVRARSNEAVAAVCVIPLPAELRFAAPHASTRDEGRSADLAPVILPPDKAQALYETAARAHRLPAILAHAGKQAICIPIEAAGRKTKLTISLRQTVGEEGGLLRYVCPMPDTSLSGDAIEKLSFTATIKHTLPLRAVLCTTHPVKITRPGLKEAQVECRADQYGGTEDLVVQYVADSDPLGTRVLTHRAKDEDEGFFLLVANPTGSEKEEPPIPKDVLFVLDTSGSMRGEKMEQARAAIEYCLDNLNPHDRFNIVAFGTDVTAFRPDVVARSPAAIKDAKAFLDDLEPSGRTNIGDALAKALAGEAGKGRMRIMLFLTDGAPTAGELVPDRILDKAKTLNKGGTRIYVFGVGTDVDARLLGKIAEGAQGTAEFIRPDDEIDVKVAALYNRLSNPILSDVAIDFGGLAVNALYPKQVATLFKGNELVLLGRYRKGGKHTVTISGTVAGEARSFRYEVDFPAAEQPRNSDVAMLWAVRRIGHLMQEIRLHGQNQELVDEIVRLGRQFGIITEYTRFLADAGAMPAAAAPTVTRDAMQKAHREIGGKWAVAQARNERRMQEAQVANAAEINAFEDAEGMEQRESRIMQIGRRAFFRKDNRWVQSSVAPKPAESAPAKARQVKFMSDDYLKLVREDKDFAEAQKLGVGVEMDVKDERIQVVE
jgi:Ca-activated chloride channel family protein